jgi:hypothetical protein
VVGADGGILERVFEDAIVSTVSQLAGVAPKVEPAPDLITDGAIGYIHIVGGWNGTVTATCSSGAIAYLAQQMPALLIDKKDIQLAVVETLLEAVGNAFMRKFTIKSTVSEPKALAWSLARHNCASNLKEMWKVSCTLPAGTFSFSLSQGTTALELEDGG